jgi:hypothetical protein
MSKIMILTGQNGPYLLKTDNKIVAMNTTPDGTTALSEQELRVSSHTRRGLAGRRANWEVNETFPSRYGFNGFIRTT